MTEDSDRSRRIQELNDAFRTTLTGGIVRSAPDHRIG